MYTVKDNTLMFLLAHCGWYESFRGEGRSSGYRVLVYCMRGRNWLKGSSTGGMSIQDG